MLLNLGAQYQVKVYQDAQSMVFAKGSNLLNEIIRNSTSYLLCAILHLNQGVERRSEFGSAINVADVVASDPLLLLIIDLVFQIQRRGKQHLLCGLELHHGILSLNILTYSMPMRRSYT
jgi:hypothetical protein